MGDPIEPLARFCREHDLGWTADAAAGFAGYLALLTEFNARTNLIGPLTEAQIVEQLFVDSIAAAVVAPPVGRGVDVGSGAGLPGIPLALLFGEAELVLVEPRRKRASFLRIARHRLGLANVEVAECRVEELDEGSFDWAISKAFRAPEQWLTTAAGLVGATGTIVCLHGREDFDRAELETAAGRPLDAVFESNDSGRKVLAFRPRRSAD